MRCRYLYVELYLCSGVCRAVPLLWRGVRLTWITLSCKNNPSVCCVKVCILGAEYEVCRIAWTVSGLLVFIWLLKLNCFKVQASLLASHAWKSPVSLYSRSSSNGSQYLGHDPTSGWMTSTPLGVVAPSQGLHIRYSVYHVFMLLFITVAKLYLWSSNQNNVMVTATWGTVLKGLSFRKAEKHSSTPSLSVSWHGRCPICSQGVQANA